MGKSNSDSPDRLKRLDADDALGRQLQDAELLKKKASTSHTACWKGDF